MQISSKNIELEEYRREIGKMIHQISSKNKLGKPLFINLVL